MTSAALADVHASAVEKKSLKTELGRLQKTLEHHQQLLVAKNRELDEVLQRTLTAEKTNTANTAAQKEHMVAAESMLKLKYEV